ncbi:MAG: low molecular weight phosphatase family protein [Mesorhizobium sp.]|nr:MAG: low molecular weight phosphatase family protein [Mesorhizobium sp.]
MNAVRSPMAEALARRMLPSAIFVASAGVRAGERDPFVDAVLTEDTLSLGERQPRTMDELEDDYFDLIVTLAPDPTDAGGTREHIMAAYRDVRERLKARIARRFPASEAKSALD